MSPAELFADNFATVLSSACGVGDALIVVATSAPTGLQGSGEFRVLVDGGTASAELMVASNVGSGTTWSVLRGSATGESPTPTVVAHASGAVVSQVLTEGGLENALAGAAAAGSAGVAAEASRAEGVEAGELSASSLGAASGPAKLGTDGTVGGPSGSPLSGSVVTASLSVKQVALGNVSGTIACDLSQGFVFVGTVTGAVTGVTFTNWPASPAMVEPLLILTQDGTGHAIGLPSVSWLPAGSSPTFDTAAGHINYIPLSSKDQGATIYGAVESAAGTSASVTWAPSTPIQANSVAALPDGSQRLRLPGAPAATRAQYDATEAGYWRDLPLPLTPFEFTPMTAFGHSWCNGGPDIAAGARMADRLSNRCKATTFNNYGVPGTRMDQILAAQVQPFWVANSLGWVLFVDGTINDSNAYVDTSGTPTTAECFRTALSIISSQAVLSSADAGIEFANGATPASMPAASYVDVAFTGDAVGLQFAFTSTAGTTFTVYTAGTSIATVSTGGYKTAFTGTERISGLGSGNHTLRVVNTGANTGQVIGAVIPSANPVPIIWVESAPRNVSSASDTLAAAYVTACEPIAAAYPNVKVVKYDSFWDETRYVGPGFHPNDLGMAYLANLAQRVMATIVHQQGLNQLLIDGQQAASYSSPAPAYQAPGATAPAAPSLTAVTGSQVALAWTAQSDNGATITGYTITSSPHGANTFTTLATVSGKTASYNASGLTASSSYDFQITATNAIGTSAASTTATATAGITSFVNDTFTDATGTALGNHTPNVGATWTRNTNVTFSGSSEVITAAQRVRSNNPSGNQALVYIPTAAPTANYTVQADFILLSSIAAQQVGISGRTDPAAVTCYMARYRPDITAFELVKKVAGTTTVIATSAAMTLTPGTTYTVQLVMNGTSLTVNVNGSVAVATQTDSAITAAGYAGLYFADTTTPTDSTGIHVDNFSAH